MFDMITVNIFLLNTQKKTQANKKNTYFYKSRKYEFT